MLKIIQGGALGADFLGKQAAATVGVPSKEFPANWDKYGKTAGVIRNKLMAQNADMLCAYWNGRSRGTKNMIDTALKQGLEVHVFRY